MQHAALSNNFHPAVATTSSPDPRRASWPNARPLSSVRVRSSSMRNGGNGSASTDSLDHPQRASMARQRQQQGEHAGQQQEPAAEVRPSVGRSGSRKQVQALDSFSFKSSEASRVEGSELSDEVTRDYYLDRLW